MLPDITDERSTGWIEGSKPDASEPFRIDYGLTKYREQDASFHIVVHHLGGSYLEPTEEQLQLFPDLRPCVRWHLAGVKTGPMHGLANAIHWMEIHARKSGALPPTYSVWSFKNGEKDKDPIGLFKMTTVFGAVPGDEMPALPEFPRRPDASLDFTHEPKEAKKVRLAWEQKCEEAIAVVVTEWWNKRFDRLMAQFEVDVRKLMPGLP